MELQFAQIKNVSIKSLDVSLPPFHMGVTMVESSVYLKRVGVEPTILDKIKWNSKPPFPPNQG